MFAVLLCHDQRLFISHELHSLQYRTLTRASGRSWHEATCQQKSLSIIWLIAHVAKNADEGREPSAASSALEVAAFTIPRSIKSSLSYPSELIPNVGGESSFIHAWSTCFYTNDAYNTWLTPQDTEH